MTTKTEPRPPGPLPLIRPVTPSLQVKFGKLMEPLKGHVTAANWLPQGLDDGLDRLRDEQLERREALGDALDELRDLAIQFSREDADHQEALVQAARDRLAQPADGRTSDEQRRALLIAHEERYIAAATVFAELVAQVREFAAKNERRIFGLLRQVKRAADERERELQAELDLAKAGVFQAEMTALWWKRTVDGGAFGGQPAPKHTTAPKVWHSQGERAFQRMYYEDANNEAQAIVSEAKKRAAEAIQQQAQYADRVAVGNFPSEDAPLPPGDDSGYIEGDGS